MKKKITVPAFVFNSVTSKNMTTQTIKRKDDVLEFEFPIFEKEEVLSIAKKLFLKKRRAHDRPIDDMIEVIHNVGELWKDPYYKPRKEALEVISMLTGQSIQLCTAELDGNLMMWNKKIVEGYLAKELGGKSILDQWITKGPIKLHAQPQGLIYHSIAGNAFSVGMMSLYYGLMTKNVNLLKLARDEPYFTVKLAQSIQDVDKKVAKELAVLYWRGRESDIFDELFNSGHVNCILAWGGLRSIQEIRQRANRYGIKIIDHGPKFSYSILSECVLKNQEEMRGVAQKLALDVALWNQRACVSPRVIYIKEKPRVSAIKNGKWNYNSENKKNDQDPFLNAFNGINYDLTTLMQRSIKLIRNEFTDLSPHGFAKILAEELQKAQMYFPRLPVTKEEEENTIKKRAYFRQKYEESNDGQVFIPEREKMNWTVVYLRNPPTLKEIKLCYDRFIIVTRIQNIQDLVYFMEKERLFQFLQTMSVYGSDAFVENVAEEFSLLGANRFPLVGEHNNLKIGAPWDGHFVLHDLVRWVNIGYGDKNLDDGDKVYIDTKME